MNYGRRFVTLHRRQESRPSPWKRNAKKAKWLSGEALQIAVKRRDAKSKGEKERYKHLNAAFQRIARRDKKAFLSDPLEKEMATHFGTLAWKSPWMEEPGRLHSMGSQRVRHD